MLPLRGSPALNPSGRLAPPSLATDQKGPGFDRIIEGIQDIGAVEASNYAAIDARVAAAMRSVLSKKIKKLKKKATVRKFNGQIKMLIRRMGVLKTSGGACQCASCRNGSSIPGDLLANC